MVFCPEGLQSSDKRLRRQPSVKASASQHISLIVSNTEPQRAAREASPSLAGTTSNALGPDSSQLGVGEVREAAVSTATIHQENVLAWKSNVTEPPPFCFSCCLGSKMFRLKSLTNIRRKKRILHFSIRFFEGLICHGIIQKAFLNKKVQICKSSSKDATPD